MNKGRIKLLILIAIFVVPMLVSWALFFHTQKTGEIWGTSNKGVLVSPMLALQDINLNLKDGAVLTLKEIETQWTLLYLMPEVCDEACREDIFHMRQVHVSVHKDFSRVQRLLVMQEANQLDTENEFLQHYDDVFIALNDDSNNPLSTQITLPDNEKLSEDVLGHIFIIDPQANVMMVYEKGVNPENLFKDLKKLLRMSRIG